MWTKGHEDDEVPDLPTSVPPLGSTKGPNKMCRGPSTRCAWLPSLAGRSVCIVMTLVSRGDSSGHSSDSVFLSLAYNPLTHRGQADP